MPIDAQRVLNAPSVVTDSSWKADDVILYHLGLGAGLTRVDDIERRYIHEDHLRVLPSFATIATYASFTLDDIPGFDVDVNLVLHGEQSVQIHHPTPAQGRVKSEMRVSNLFDKGKAALIEQTIESRDADGNHLFTLRSSGFAPGEGGFGGERGPRSGADKLPDREPDFVVDSPTLAGQAFLYRLSGDKNPLHVDPAVSGQLGHDVPILHGLCTYGMACKAAVDAVLEGEVDAVASYTARFSGVVYPGETLQTSIWRDGTAVAISVRTKERGERVLSHCRMMLR